MSYPTTNQENELANQGGPGVPEPKKQKMLKYALISIGIIMAILWLIS